MSATPFFTRSKWAGGAPSAGITWTFTRPSVAFSTSAAQGWIISVTTWWVGGSQFEKRSTVWAEAGAASAASSAAAAAAGANRVIDMVRAPVGGWARGLPPSIT